MSVEPDTTEGCYYQETGSECVSVEPSVAAQLLFLFLRTSSPGHPSEDEYVTVLDSQNFVDSKHKQCLILKVFMCHVEGELLTLTLNDVKITFLRANKLQ